MKAANEAVIADVKNEVAEVKAAVVTMDEAAKKNQAALDQLIAEKAAKTVNNKTKSFGDAFSEQMAEAFDAKQAEIKEFQNKIEKYKATGEIDYYPPANSKDADRMYPAADEAAVVNLPGRAEQLADQILAANADIKEAEGKRSEAETELKAMLGQASKGTVGRFEIRWPMRSYKATPEKVVPAKEAYSISKFVYFCFYSP